MTSPPQSPAVSVVIPTLGRPKPLRDCLDALSRQLPPEGGFEVIVVNDGGGPAVEEVVGRRRDDLPVTVASTGGAGAAAARNRGVREARGGLIAFTDDDCCPEPGWLTALQRALGANPGAAVGGRMVNGAAGRSAEGAQAVLDATHEHFNAGADGARFFATSNVAFPRDDLLALGGFDERFAYAEDRELCEHWLRSGHRFAYAPDAVVRHMKELTPVGLWRQHFGYGRGAWQFHRKRQEHGWGRFAVEPGFYRQLARQVRRPRDGAGTASVAALALVAQVANAAGFAREAVLGRPSSSPETKGR